MTSIGINQRQGTLPWAGRTTPGTCSPHLSRALTPPPHLNASADLGPSSSLGLALIRNYPTSDVAVPSVLGRPINNSLKVSAEWATTQTGSPNGPTLIQHIKAPDLGNLSCRYCILITAEFNSLDQH